MLVNDSKKIAICLRQILGCLVEFQSNQIKIYYASILFIFSRSIAIKKILKTCNIDILLSNTN